MNDLPRNLKLEMLALSNRKFWELRPRETIQYRDYVFEALPLDLQLIYVLYRSYEKRAMALENIVANLGPTDRREHQIELVDLWITTKEIHEFFLQCCRNNFSDIGDKEVRICLGWRLVLVGYRDFDPVISNFSLRKLEWQTPEPLPCADSTK